MIDADIQAMFAVPLVHIRIQNWEMKKRVLLKLMYESTMRRDTSSDRLTTDYHNQFINDEVGIYNKDIQDLFGEEIDYLAEEMHLKDATVQMSWFERSGQFDYHTVHNHGYHGFSSVVFIKFDENAHEATKFVCPYYGFLHQDVIIHSPDVKEGDIIFFPSCISHFTNPNKSKKERLILSFNLKCTD
jgi:hypothetical protein